MKNKIFPSKLDKIVSERYGKRSEFVNDYFERFNSDIENASKSWFSGRSTPKSNVLYNLCVLLDCDIEYLLGNQHEYRREYKTGSDITGLSEKSIEHIIKLTTAQRKALDIMFEYYDMNRFLQSLITAASFINMDGEITISLNSAAYQSGENVTDNQFESPKKQAELEEKLNSYSSKELLMFQINQDSLKMIEHVLDNDAFKEEAKKETRLLIRRRYEQNKPEEIKKRYTAYIECPEKIESIDELQKGSD